MVQRDLETIFVPSLAKEMRRELIYQFIETITSEFCSVCVLSSLMRLTVSVLPLKHLRSSS
jgi:predicted nucleic-acid-binding protein